MDELDRSVAEVRRAAAEAARAACLDAAAAAWDEAGLAGLCPEGRWERALDAMRDLDLGAVIGPRGGRGDG